MSLKLSDPAATPAQPSGLGMRPMKIVVAGGFAAGKTTFVDALSEITPLTTEAPMTSVALGVDNAGEVSTKTTTTVALDFGRITLSDQTMLYLFGTPGQDRFWFMWDELSRGAVGAVVLVDTRRLGDCFPAIDYFENRSIPYIVACNSFNGQLSHDVNEVHEALAVPVDVPVLALDARNRAAAKGGLIRLVQHAIRRRHAAG